MLTYTAKHHDHCRRLESFLRTLMPQASAGYARKLIKSGAVKRNSLTASPDTMLSFNDAVTLKESAVTTALLTPRRPLLDILYEDDQLVVVNKPPGLPMHQTSRQETNLVDESIAYMTRRGTPCKLYPVNRLDRGTSGVVILAKSSTNAAIYGRQVKETGLDKLYLALVTGCPDSGGVINAPLDEKESETRYRILLQGEGCSLLAVTPISGRTHQIRRHLELISHPVWGDTRYGGVPAAYAGIGLHSFRTLIVRSEAGELTACAPLPDDFLLLCACLGIGTDELLKSVWSLSNNRTGSAQEVEA